jgi:integrase
MHRMARAAALDLKGLRDRALLLLGFGGAFRRSELAALNVDDLEFTDDGLRVTIRRSKTDQEGRRGRDDRHHQGRSPFAPS